MLIPSKFSGYRADGVRLYLGGKGSDVPAPDPRLVEAQIKSMGVQDEVISAIMRNSNETLPLQKQQMQFGLETARQAYEQSQQDRSFGLGMRGKLAGVQDKIASAADSFDEAARGEELAGQTQADIEQQFGAAQAQQQRALDRRGVNPSSGAALAMGNQASLQKATAKAGAGALARSAAKAEGLSLVDRANNALAGYPAMGMSATGAGAGYGGLGLNYANSGLAGMNSGFGMGASVAGQMGQNATSMFGQQANYKTAQDQIAASSDPLNTMLGAAAGAGMAYMTGGMFKPKA